MPGLNRPAKLKIIQEHLLQKYLNRGHTPIPEHGFLILISTYLLISEKRLQNLLVFDTKYLNGRVSTPPASDINFNDLL